MLPLDHILWAVPDRDQGIAYFEQLTGIRAAIGGSHPGRGTRNALVSLGRKVYLELIAPDPEQPPANNFGNEIRSLTAPRLLTFVVDCPDLETLSSKAAKAKIPFKGPEPWSRGALNWRLAFTEDTRFGGLLPIYIDWQKSSHPALSAPAGLSLAEFEVMHPDAESLAAVYAALDIGMTVRRSDRPALRAVIRGPRGDLILNS
jgi:hypothetical protein